MRHTLLSFPVGPSGRTLPNAALSPQPAVSSLKSPADRTSAGPGRRPDSIEKIFSNDMIIAPIPGKVNRESAQDPLDIVEHHQHHQHHQRDEAGRMDQPFLFRRNRLAPDGRPPSSAGRGSRFITPRLTESSMARFTMFMNTSSGPPGAVS